MNSSMLIKKSNAVKRKARSGSFLQAYISQITYAPLVAALVLLVFSSMANAGTQTFTANGSWVPPVGVTSVTVQCWGGGGGGGGATASMANQSNAAGGGGGGGFTSGVVAVANPTSYNVVVGTGGAGGLSTGGNGTNGASSTFNATSVVCGGGTGGTGVSTNNANGAGGAGGTGTNAGGAGSVGKAGTPYGGGGGGGAGTGAVGSPGTNGAPPNGGAGGATGGGTGGSSTLPTTGTCITNDGVSGFGDGSGSVYGGGGAGASCNKGAAGAGAAGGNGANGQIILTWTDPPTTNVADGGTPSAKFAKTSTTLKSVDSFTLATSTGTDTVTSITITKTGTALDADVAASGVKIYLDAGTANEYDALDTLQGAGCTLSAGTCTVSGLAIAVNTTPKNFIITFDTAASIAGAEEGKTLTATVTAITATNIKVYGDSTSSNLTLDVTGPADGAAFTAAPGNAQCFLSWNAASDGAGSGMSATDAYKLVFLTGATPPNANCTNGTDLTAVTTGITYTHTTLTNGTQYSYRVCGIDSVGNISTGLTASCTPTAAVVVPTVISPTATGVVLTTATLGANVLSNGGAALTARGTCWGTTAAPTGNCVAQGGTTTGVFTHARSALTAGTKLFYRGYATNSAGTGYSIDGSFYTEPSTQASGVGFTGVNNNDMTVNWTRGSGDGVIVVVAEGSSVPGVPVDGTYNTYTANSVFGDGTNLGSSSFVVYKGTGTSVAVTGLMDGTRYSVAVYEYKGTVDTAGSDLGTNYASTPATGSQVTTGVPGTVTFGAAGIMATGGGPITALWPTGHLVGDVGLLVVESSGADIVSFGAGGSETCFSVNPIGTLPITSPVTIAGGTRLWAYWCRATSSAMGTVTLNVVGDHVNARILTFKGVDPNNPIDVISVSGTGSVAALGTVTIPGATTTGNGSHVVSIVSLSSDVNTPQFSLWANANLTGFAARDDQFSNSGDGGGVGIASGDMATAATYGATTVTAAPAGDWAAISFAFKPDPSNVILSGVGTVLSSTTSTAVNPTMPGTAVAGELLVAVVEHRFSASTITPAAGWTQVAQGTGTCGADGADTGSAVSTIFVKEAAGGETGATTVANISVGFDVWAGVLMRYVKKNAANLWSYGGTGGGDSVANTAWSVTGAANPGIKIGDWVIVGTGVNTDLYAAYTAKTVSAAGVTAWGASEDIIGDSIFGTGNDGTLTVSRHSVKAGTATGAPVYAATSAGFTATAPCGGSAFLRVREVSSVTVGNGADPGNVTVAPGSGIVDLDGFTLSTSSGTDMVTALTVTLAPASSNTNIAQVDITDASNVARCTAVANPASTAVAFTGCNIAVTTTATDYKVRITPKTHANMPSPATGVSYATTGTVTAVVANSEIKNYNDTTSATITVDNASPTSATATSSAVGYNSATINWTASASADFDATNGSVILRWASTTAGGDVPVEGNAAYVAGDVIGAATVACVISGTGAKSVVDGSASATAGCTTADLTNGTAYSYKVFQRDTNGNYDAGISTNLVNIVPTGVSVGNGTDPGNVTIAPGATATNLDAFSLQTAAGTCNVTNLTATFPSGMLGQTGGIETVDIYDDAGAAMRAGTSVVVSGAGYNGATTVTMTPSVAIPAGTAATTYKVRITPKTHANMPAVPGTSYAATATITAVTSTCPKAYADSGSATVTIDNQSPTSATSVSAVPGNQNNTVNWTTSGSADFGTSVILRWTTPCCTDVPVEGNTTYIAGNVIGNATVACVISGTGVKSVVDGTTGATAGCSNGNLANGTAYTYKVFQRDTNGNYDVGVLTNSVTPNVYTVVGNGTTQPSDKAVGVSQTNKAVDTFTLYATSGTDSVTAITITRGGTGTNADVASAKIYLDNGSVANEWDATDTLKATCTVGASCTITPAISINTTPQNFIITYDTAATLSGHGNTLTGTVTAIAATNVNKTYNDTSSATLTIDSQGPTYVWSSPADGQYYKAGASFTATASVTDSGSAGITNGVSCNTKIDAAAPAAGVFTTTPNPIVYSSGSGNCSGTVTIGNPTSLIDGAHTVTFTVADAFNNSTTSATKTINVDTTAPSPTAAESTGPTTVQVTFTEAGSGLDTASAEVLTNYTLKTNCSAALGTVNSATLVGNVVTLGITGASMTDGATYCVTVKNVKDTALTGGNAISAAGVNSPNFVYVANAVPPAVTDLKSSISSPRSLDLMWTEPTDTDGYVASYEVKFHDAIDQPGNITNSTVWTNGWQAANEAIPSASGGGAIVSTLSCEWNGADNSICSSVAGRKLLWPNTLYYAAMKSVDNLGAYSALSNVAKGTDTVNATHTALRPYNFNYISLPYNWGSAAAGKKLSNIFGDDVGTVYLYRWNSAGSFPVDIADVSLKVLFTGGAFSATVTPDTLIDAGVAWKNEAGAALAVAKINDASDATYARTAITSQGDVLKAGYANPTTTGAITGVILTVRARYTGTGTAPTLDFIPYDTTDATWVVSGAPYNLTTAFANYTKMWNTPPGGAATTLSAPGTPTTLTGNMTTGATTAAVTSTAGFPTAGALLITGTEFVSYTGTTATSFTGLTRAQGGTIAVTHATGDAVIPAILDNTTTITVASTTGFPASGNILVDNEWMSYTGTTATTFTGVTRGVGGGASCHFNNGVVTAGWTTTRLNNLAIKISSSAVEDQQSSIVDVSTANPDVNTLTNGKGYYIYAPNSTSVLDQYDVASAAVTTTNAATFVIVPVEPGYNWIGNPWPMNLPVSANVLVCASNGGTVTGFNGTSCTGTGTITTKTLANAVIDTHYSATTWLSNAMYYMANESTYSFDVLTDAATVMRPWWGVALWFNGDAWMDATDGAALTAAPADPDNKVVIVLKRPY